MGQSTEELTSQIEDTRSGWRRTSTPCRTGEPLGDRGAAQAGGAGPGLVGQGQGDGVGAERQGLGLLGGVVGHVRTSVRQQRRVDRPGPVSRGAPLAAGLVAFGAGVVLASLLPASRIEAEAAHRVVETAKEQGQPLLDEARAAGEEIVRNLKESATDSARQVKDSAQESAQTVSRTRPVLGRVRPGRGLLRLTGPGRPPPSHRRRRGRPRYRERPRFRPVGERLGLPRRLQDDPRGEGGRVRDSHGGYLRVHCMRGRTMRTVIVAVIVIWLVLGAVAAASEGLLRRRPGRQLQDGQRHGADDPGGPAQLCRRQPEGEVQDPAALDVARKSGVWGRQCPRRRWRAARE